jgi:hypothetical protein
LSFLIRSFRQSSSCDLRSLTMTSHAFIAFSLFDVSSSKWEQRLRSASSAVLGAQRCQHLVPNSYGCIPAVTKGLCDSLFAIAVGLLPPFDGHIQGA